MQAIIVLFFVIPFFLVVFGNAAGELLHMLWVVIKTVFITAFAVGVIVALVLLRERIVRWYYLLTPHPAQQMVDAAIYNGREFDGKAFADIMRPMPGGRIEKEVRAEQARALVAKANAHADRMRREA